MKTLGLALGLFVFLAMDLVLGGLFAPLHGGPNFTLLFVLFAALYVENVSPVFYWIAGILLDAVVAPRPGLYALTLLVGGQGIAAVRAGRRVEAGLAVQAAVCFGGTLAAEAVYAAASGAVAALGWRVVARIALGTAAWAALLGPPVFFGTRCAAAFLGLQWQEAAVESEAAAWRH